MLLAAGAGLANRGLQRPVPDFKKAGRDNARPA